MEIQSLGALKLHKKAIVAFSMPDWFGGPQQTAYVYECQSCQAKSNGGFFQNGNEFRKRKSIPEKRKLIPRDVAKTVAVLGKFEKRCKNAAVFGQSNTATKKLAGRRRAPLP
jgi:hypothetical protein